MRITEGKTNKQPYRGVLAPKSGFSKEAADDTRLCTHALDWHQTTSFPFSRGFLDRVKDIMGQIEAMW